MKTYEFESKFNAETNQLIETAIIEEPAHTSVVNGRAQQVGDAKTQYILQRTSNLDSVKPKVKITKNRITSYNVCYTKLLRSCRSAGVYRRRPLSSKKCIHFNIPTSRINIYNNAIFDCAIRDNIIHNYGPILEKCPILVFICQCNGRHIPTYIQPGRFRENYRICIYHTSSSVIYLQRVITSYSIHYTKLYENRARI